MFEVGKFYRFKMWEPGSNGGTITKYVPCKILEVDPPLVGAGARAARPSGARAVTLTFGVGSRRQHG